ncbi:MAG TPA: hypothetical protein VHY35_13790 [Stellaceae bacterium]|jgi:hypothetical protein|nr:hypothetical protein [Stellaceae bacterium]
MKFRALNLVLALSFASLFSVATQAQVQPGQGGGGGVSSVTFTGDGTVLSDTPSDPVTSSGTLAASLNLQAAHAALMGPIDGSAAAPTFRSATCSDISDAGPLCSGTLNIPEGNTCIVSIFDGNLFQATTVNPPLFEGEGCSLGIDVFTDADSGIVPSSGGGTVNFLRADGSWAVPGMATSGSNATSAALQNLATAAAAQNLKLGASGGFVGIATSGAPLFPFDIGGLFSTSPVTGFTIEQGISANANAGIGMEIRNTSNGIAAYSGYQLSDNNGQDYASLMLPSSGNTATRFGLTLSSTAQLVTGTNGGSGRILVLGTVGANDMLLGTNNASRIYLTSTGFTGVGTNTPNTLLHISAPGSPASHTSTTLGQLDTNFREQINTATVGAGAEVSFFGRTDTGASVALATYAAISAPIAGSGATGSSGNLILSTKATTATTLTPRVFILSTGNIGFGGVTTPTQMMTMSSSGSFAWDNGSGTADTGLSRSAAGIINVGTGAPGSAAGTLNATLYEAAGTAGLASKTCTINTANVTTGITITIKGGLIVGSTTC